jgi:hypothetical protein
MKITNASRSLAFAALLLGSASLTYAQVPDLTISTFDSGTPGVQPSGCGKWYGSVAGAWDNTVDNSGNMGGSLYVSAVISSASDTPSTEYICAGGGNPWYVPTVVNLSQYLSIQFDILWDNALSDITIDQFNNPGTFPASYTTSPGACAGSINGFDLLAANGNGTPAFAWITNFSVPTAASNGWVHMRIPINPTTAGIDGGSGILFKKWINNSGQLVGTHYANFWIDNVILEGTAAPPPPPTIQPLTTAISGFNVIASTAGVNDRQSARLVQTNGLSWVGHATDINPVTYSFTIKDVPKDSATAYGIEAYLFLCPDLNEMAGAPDWNGTNCIVASVQHNPNGSAYMNFQYKVNEDHQNQMFYGGTEARGSYTNVPGSWDGVTPNYLEKGNLGSVGSSSPVGTWTIKFTSDTNVTLIAPNGNTNSFIFPAYNAPLFASDTNFVIYLGMQANNSASLNKAVVYSDFSVGGTPNPYSENFLAESVLDTTNTWRTGVASGPAGVRIIPSTAAYWAIWTLPDTGFHLQNAGAVAGPYTTLTNGPIIGLANARGQVISTSELPGDTAFFRLIK